MRSYEFDKFTMCVPNHHARASQSDVCINSAAARVIDHLVRLVSHSQPTTRPRAQRVPDEMTGHVTSIKDEEVKQSQNQI